MYILNLILLFVKIILITHISEPIYFEELNLLFIKILQCM